MQVSGFPYFLVLSILVKFQEVKSCRIKHYTIYTSMSLIFLSINIRSIKLYFIISSQKKSISSFFLNKRKYLKHLESTKLHHSSTRKNQTITVTKQRNRNMIFTPKNTVRTQNLPKYIIITLQVTHHLLTLWFYLSKYYYFGVSPKTFGRKRVLNLSYFYIGNSQKV